MVFHKAMPSGYQRRHEKEIRRTNRTPEFPRYELLTGERRPAKWFLHEEAMQMPQDRVTLWRGIGKNQSVAPN